MPKGRHLKPDFFTDKNIVSVSPLARLLFQGLWCYAADCGHLDDEPLEFKLRILPADNCDVDELLTELADQGRIVREKGAIYIPTLAKHGRVDKRYETACDACKARREHAEKGTSEQGSHGVNTTGPRSEHDVTTRAGTPNHDADGDGDGDGDKNTRSSFPPSGSSTDVEREFDDWWKHYPRKVGKGQARKAYRAARKKTTPETLTSALAAQRSILLARGERFCPHAATWLNGERWDDQQSQHLALVENDPASLPPVEETWMRRRPQ